MRRDRGAISNDDQLAPGTREGDVHAARIGEKSYVTVAVRAYEAHNDGFFLASLKTVHAIDFDLMLYFLAQQLYLR